MKHTGKNGNASGTFAFAQILNDRRSVILSALGAKVDGLTRLDRVSDEDQAQASHEEFVNLRLNGMEYQQLREIQVAIEKIRSGEFGICEHCEEPIAVKRLHAIPWAKYCISCQEQVAEGFIAEREPVYATHGFQEHAIS